MLWTKRSHQCTFFQTLECSNKSSPNPSCQFWNHKVRVYSNFTSLFSVIKDNSSHNSSEIFQLKHYILWTKRAHRSEIFRLFSSWVEIHQISHIILETKSQFFFNLCITFQYHEKWLFCTFFAETLYDLEKRSPSKCKTLDFRPFMWNVTKFVLWKAPFIESI